MISDTQLEFALRDLRGRADHLAPPPADLAQRTRQRYRAQRRSRAALAAGALATLVVVVGVPVAASTYLGDPDRTAAPSDGPAADVVPTLAELSTRGSLAGDPAWLDAVEQLPWASAPADEPPVTGRIVAFAGDVPGARVALVLDTTGAPVHAWFVGPVGASPGQMTLAAQPTETIELAPIALMDAPQPASDSRTLVVVAWPGDDVSLVTGRSVDAAGEASEKRRPVPVTDGIGAIATDGPPTWPVEVQLWVKRNTGVPGSYNPTLTVSDRSTAAYRPAVAMADPRGLLDSVRADDVQATVTALAGYYGLPAADLRPTLLAAGPPAAGSPSSTVLVGITFPSGATAAAELILWPDDDGSGLSSQVALTETAPAGTALLDRVFVVPASVPGGLMLTISGPESATRAVVQGRDGALLVTVPLLEGAGTGAVPANPDGATVRFLDAAGALVATAPITGPVHR
jgi:hypothetical protein